MISPAAWDEASTGLIFSTKRFAVHDGPGIRTTVFFKGCPLSCKWCHNPEGMKSSVTLSFDEAACVGPKSCGVDCPGPNQLKGLRGSCIHKKDEIIIRACPTQAVRGTGRHVTVSEILTEVEKDRAFYETSGGGITLSGGEPLQQPSFLAAVLMAARAGDLHTVLDTCLCADWELIESLVPWVDLFHVDLKVMDPEIHLQATGLDNQVILANLERLSQLDSIGIQIRIPLIPGWTDGEENLRAIAEYLGILPRQLPVELLPYNPLGAQTCLRLGLPPLELEETQNARSLTSARKLFEEYGITCRSCTFPSISREPSLKPRNARLRERALSLVDSRPPLERPLLFTQGFRKAKPEKPLIVQRARGFAAFLEGCSLSVYPEQKILGDSLRAIAGVKGVGDEYRLFTSCTCPETWGGAHEELPAAVNEALEFWRGRQTGARAEARYSDASRIARQEGLYDSAKSYFGHIIPNFEVALKKGFLGIRDQAKQRLAQATTPDKRAFYQAVVISCDGVIQWGARYQQLAAEQGLVELAELAGRVPAHPPRTFHEALQMVWFVHQLNEMEAPAVYTHSFGRFDQYLYSYYESDMAAGRLDQEKVLGLLEEFWIKCYRLFDEQHTTIGGLRPDGSDGTNELSFLCLQAMRNVALPRAVGARIHKNTDRSFLLALIDTLHLGMGVPAIFNDDVIVPALVEQGIPVAHAREYGAVGCIEISIPAHIEMLTPALFFNSTKVLELALNQGRAMMTGLPVGPMTPPVETMGFDDLLSAFNTQLSSAVQLGCQDQVIAEQQLMDDQPMPLYSCLIPACMEEGTDALRRKGNAHFTGVCLTEVATTINSLAAIKQHCFASQSKGAKRSLTALADALRENFEGREPLRLSLANSAVFGEDEVEVDALGSLVLKSFCKELSRHPHPREGNYVPLVFSRPHRQLEILGVQTAASADGRRAGTLLGVSLNPTNGTARKGLTAIANSQNRLPLGLLAGGVSNNLDLDSSVLMGDGREKLADWLRVWARTGGMEVALQFATRATLLAAQENPERYGNVAVRVYGFSEIFVRMERHLQDYIIQRMEMTSGH